MAVLHRLGVVVLVVALTTTLFGANLALGVERTVLDEEFVTTTLEEEDAYDAVLEMVGDQLATVGENVTGATTADAGGAGGSPATGDAFQASVDERLDDVVTPEYLQSQTEANVEATLGYLHGERDELELAVDLRPVKERAGEVVAAEISGMEPAELFGLFAGDGTAEAGTDGGPSMGLLARLARNESSYEAARAEVRAGIVEDVVANRTDAAYERASDDERLALVVEDYDPDDYDEAEKAAMVAEREPEIREAMAAQVEAEVEDELDAILAEERDALRDEVASSLEADAELDPALRAAFEDVALLYVDGVLGDLSYEEFDARAQETRDTLAVALSGAILDGIDAEVPDELDLMEDIDPAAMESLSTARTAVGLLDALAIVLWLVAAVLVGLLWWLSRSVPTTAIWSGVALVAAGTPVALGTRWAGGRLRALEPTDPAAAGAFDLIVPVAERVLSVVWTQSLVLAVVGLLLVGFGLAVRFELLPEERLRLPR